MESTKVLLKNSLIFFFVLLVGCTNNYKATGRVVEDFEASSIEVDNIKVSSEMEKLESWAETQAPAFQVWWNKTYPNEQLAIPSGKHYKVVLVSPSVLRQTYKSVNPFFYLFLSDSSGKLFYYNEKALLNRVVAFCWHDRQLIVLSRNRKIDLYHEVGHAQFPLGSESMAEIFAIWCEEYK